MRLHAYHGVLQQERVVGNDYLISAEIVYPIARAMQTDDVADTINYAEVAEVIKQQMAVPSALIEHVAGRISQALKERFPFIVSIRLSVKKIAPPMSVDCDGAGVVIQQDYASAQ